PGRPARRRLAGGGGGHDGAARRSGRGQRRGAGVRGGGARLAGGLDAGTGRRAAAGGHGVLSGSGGVRAAPGRRDGARRRRRPFRRAPHPARALPRRRPVRTVYPDRPRRSAERGGTQLRFGRLTDHTDQPDETGMPAAEVATELERVRRRSLAYTNIADDELVRQHSTLMSPLVWDLAHVGNYEDLWLVRAITRVQAASQTTAQGQAAPTRAGLDDIYDAFRHDRASRVRLDLLGPDAARAYLREVRNRSLDLLEQLDRLPADAATGTDSFVYRMVIQHEHQHAETMLATHQLRTGPP